MYSVVLMMAMTTSVDVPDCHNNCGCTGYVAGCTGCTGYTACCGCTGGHRLFGGGFCGCTGGHRLFGGHGCHGCTGGYGCTGCTGVVVGCTGCTGGVVPMPPPPVKPAEELKTKPKPEGGKEAYVPTPATIIVSLPADAKLTIDEIVTKATSTERVFESPVLPVGRDFSYTLKAEFKYEGKPVVVTKKVNVRAGLESHVTIGAADLTGVASR